jgi:hypothetical protein
MGSCFSSVIGNQVGNKPCTVVDQLRNIIFVRFIAQNIKDQLFEFNKTSSPHQ